MTNIRTRLNTEAEHTILADVVDRLAQLHSDAADLTAYCEGLDDDIVPDNLVTRLQTIESELRRLRDLR